uniref:Uncharacterized protein n=1 Tax=Oryza glumipatula TaxID=40148 RepID=A0A0D9Z937_9ORYZ
MDSHSTPINPSIGGGCAEGRTRREEEHDGTREAGGCRPAHPTLGEGTGGHPRDGARRSTFVQPSLFLMRRYSTPAGGWTE